MALTVKFYSVSKAVNSTALPTGEPMAEYECRMLDACSILRPVILLNVGPQANPPGLTTRISRSTTAITGCQIGLSTAGNGLLPFRLTRLRAGKRRSVTPFSMC